MLHTAVNRVAMASAALLLAGCGGTTTPEPGILRAGGASPAAPVEDGPTLVVAEPNDASFDALVSGRIGVNAKGCVTLDDELLIAPAGSRLAGRVVHVPGYEPASIGDEVQLGGGHEELHYHQLDAREKPCASPHGLTHVVAVAPGRS